MFFEALSDDEIIYELNSQCVEPPIEEEKSFAPHMEFAVTDLSQVHRNQSTSTVEIDGDKRSSLISQSFNMLTDFLFPDSQE